MSKYHVNADGDVKPCKASLRSCPVGSLEEHFDNPRDARAHYENKNSSFANAFTRKFKNLNKAKTITALVGSTLAMTVVLTGCSVPKHESNFNKPSNSQSSAQEYLDQTMKDIDNLAGQANDYLTENTPDYSEDYTNPAESSATDPSTVTWQGKPLQPTEEEVANAYSVLEQIPITNPLDGSNYNRDDFGSYDRVAGDIEQRDYPFLQFNENGRASGGSFIDPYSGMSVEIVPGKKDDSDVEHIVALKEVFISQRYEGQLSPDQMNAISTDFDNLAIVSSSENRSKKDKDAGQWIVPSYEPAQCTYIVSQIKVKGKYSLTVDGPEYEAMKNVLDNKC